MKSTDKLDLMRFILFSMIGIIVFFIPAIDGKVPVVFAIGSIKALLGAHLKFVAIVSETILLILLFLSEIVKLGHAKRYFSGESVLKKTLFIPGILIVAILASGINLPVISNPKITGNLLDMASTVFITIALAGTMVFFILKSGIVEFVSVITEPVMRPVFKLPGQAAMNMISSFVSSASVGVYFTECFYKEKVYTDKEACAGVCNFSVISVGYIGVLCTIAKIEEMYGTLVLSSFILVLIMSVIMIRIPPLCMIPDTYIDKSDLQIRQDKMSLKNRMALAVRKGILKTKEFTVNAFLKNFFQALCFAQKIIAVMIPVVAMVLVLLHYTPLFKILGQPIAPIIDLLKIPDAELIAPSVLVGIVEVSLPSILISGFPVSKMSAFFIVQLSIVQIIFFSEAGNAILGSAIPLNALKLIQIFIVRTIIALPLVAMITHLIF